jgi:hypothetical protein
LLHNKEEEFKSKHTHTTIYIYIVQRERRVGVIRIPPSSSLFLLVNIYQSERLLKVFVFLRLISIFPLLL